MFRLIICLVAKTREGIEIDKQTFSERLKTCRIQKGLTQQEVAQAIGMTGRNYQRYEVGVTVPRYSVLHTLSDYLGVTVDYLLGDEKGVGGLCLGTTDNRFSQKNRNKLSNMAKKLERLEKQISAITKSLNTMLGEA